MIKGENTIADPPVLQEGIGPGEEFRQHPIKVAEEVLTAAIVALFLIVTLYFSISDAESGAKDYALPISALLFLAILASALWISFWRWRNTLIQFRETEIRVFRDTVFKREVRIAYTKIASTNINRGVINRITDTSKLMININSRVNAVVPELTLTFDAHLTDRIRKDLATKMHNREFVANDSETPSVLKVTGKDIIIHSLLSQPTASSIFGIAMFLIATFQIFVFSDNSAMGTIALLMFVMSYAIPVTVMMFHYYNYRIYKSGDTIYISHGLVRTYHKSFRTTRINAVRLRSPLIPRLLGRYMLDAEVVGLVAGGDGGNPNTPPLLCPMKDKATIDSMLETLVPDFVPAEESILQPKEAAVPIFARVAIYSVIVASISHVLNSSVQSGIGSGDLSLLFAGIAVLIILGLILHGTYTFRVVSFGKEEETFTFVTGVVDRKKVIVKYDKVQMATTSEGPLSKPFGLARGNVNLLASMGSQSIQSGYFRSEDMKGIYEEVVARINDLRYDYRKYL